MVVAISITVAVLHFVTGENYQGPCPQFVTGHLIDLLLPFSAYFLLCLVDHPFFRSWLVKCLTVFTFGLSVELAQYHGIKLLGSTFDPLDIIMYAAGVLIAAFLDTQIFPRLFPFWNKTLPSS